MIDVILIAVIAVAVFFVVRRELKKIRRRQFCGGCTGCSGNPKNCGRRGDTSDCCVKRDEESGD